MKFLSRRKRNYGCRTIQDGLPKHECGLWVAETDTVVECLVCGYSWTALYTLGPSKYYPQAQTSWMKQGPRNHVRLGIWADTTYAIKVQQ